jgi:hypothetical protein
MRSRALQTFFLRLQGGRAMIDPKVASLRSHSNNISRYRGLLRTNLSDLERQFIERRLNEERMAMEAPALRRVPIILTLSNSMREVPPSEQ